MELKQQISNAVIQAFQEIFNQSVSPEKIILQQTNPDFEGDITLVVFPLLKFSGKKPEDTGNIIGEYLKSKNENVSAYNVIKGFLNLVISDTYWISFLNKIISSQSVFQIPVKKNKSLMVEFSSPNTNKPLHLGHLRNNFLGYSLSKILEANGYDVLKSNLVNDRGIHICKTMLAWQKWGNNQTPETTYKKGDHLVGEFYVEFDKKYKEEIHALVVAGESQENAERNAPLIKETQTLLKKWEDNDPETKKLWKKMNDWVYDGFTITYKKMGVDFDKIYYESETYLSGKEIVKEGLNKKIFISKEDGSVWINLTDSGLDEKLLLRSDGTSVYITQDIGTVKLRLDEYDLDKIIYVVGNEQDYHFKVLNIIINKLYPKWQNRIYHLSYGMVDLPSGKMKSREGTVVDADELIDEMILTAERHTRELGKIDEFSDEEAKKLFEKIGLAALKYHILKVDPKKKMLFNPEESIDFHGNTGPFIQYTYARIQSVLKNSPIKENFLNSNKINTLHPLEKTIIKLIHKYPEVLEESAKEYSPAVIANYVYEFAKQFNKFYSELSILNAENEELKSFRLTLSKSTGLMIQNGMMLLGIEVAERM